MIDGAGNGKIADFSVAKKVPINNDTLFGIEGTYFFFSPEMINDNLIGYSGKATDIWALGVCLYCYTFNELPFYSNDIDDMKQMIVSLDCKLHYKAQFQTT